MSVLTAASVWAICEEVLFRDAEIIDGKPPVDAVIVSGIVNTFAFHPGRLKAAEPRIRELLADLPEVFKDGMSFLNACMTKDGVHWGEHRDMGLLFCLGVGVDAVKEVLPREMWHLFPGGMPYYIVKA